MTIHCVPLAEAFEVVRSAPEGLSSAEALRRLAEYGPNRVQRARREPALVRLLRELFRFFSVILWIAAGLAFVARCQPGEGMAQIGYVIVADFNTGAFSFWQEHRIERTLAALERLLPQHVKVLRDGSARLLPIEQIVVGDVIILEQGDNIPADCRLAEAFGVKVNAATVLDGSPAEMIDAKAKDLATRQLAQIAARKAAKAAPPGVVKSKPASEPPTKKAETPEQLRSRVRASLLRRTT